VSPWQKSGGFSRPYFFCWRRERWRCCCASQTPVSMSIRHKNKIFMGKFCIYLQFTFCARKSPLKTDFCRKFYFEPPIFQSLAIFAEIFPLKRKISRSNRKSAVSVGKFNLRQKKSAVPTIGAAFFIVEFKFSTNSD